MKPWVLGIAALSVALILALFAIRRFHPAFASFPRVEPALLTGAIVFEGGPSPIDSSDPHRAAKAVERVTPQLTRDLQQLGLEMGSPIFIRIFKESYDLELWVADSAGRFERFRTYRIAAMSGRLGPKIKEGDYQAPEGFYKVTRGRFNPQSRYHLSFDIGYPNALDRSLARTGSHIMIHGKSASIGCYAMTDASIEEIYTLGSAAIEAGQPGFPVHIFPFRMTDDRMAAAADSRHLDFWKNLREGHDAFLADGVPPTPKVADGRYRLN